MKRGVAILLVFLGSLVGAFLWGRSSKPAEIREVTVAAKETQAEVKAAAVEKRNEGTEQVAARVIIRRVMVPGAPASCPPVEERIEETGITRTFDLGETRVDLSGTEKTKERTETVKVTSAGRAGWRLEVGGQWDTDRLALAKPETWRFSGSRRLAGPFWIGASYSTDKAVGVHLGAEW